MSVLQPWMLAFGLVALVPLVLHLIGRQRARVVHFSALSFLLARDPKRARALRLEQRLLVATRMGLAGLIALVLAQPLLPDWGVDDALSLGEEPVAVVIVLDNSVSMATRTALTTSSVPSARSDHAGVADGAGAVAAAPAAAAAAAAAVSRGPSRFSRALARAAAQLRALPPGSRAAVVTSSRPARARQLRLSTDLRSVAADLGQIGQSDRPDDASHALHLARRLLAQAPAATRRLVVVSDLQTSGWGNAALRQPDVRVLAVGAAASDIVLRDAVVEAGADLGAQQVRVRVTVARLGPTAGKDVTAASGLPWHGTVQLRIGGREVRQGVALAPGQTLQRTFVVPAIADALEVSVHGTVESSADRASLGDAQPKNNTRWLRLRGGATLRVVVVNGAPQPVARQDEVFFFVRALQAGAERSGEVRVEVVRPEQLSADATGVGGAASWDVLVLANVAELSGAQVAAIRRRVRAGAGLLISLGDQTADADATWLKDLFPGLLAGVTAGRPHALRAVTVGVSRASGQSPKAARSSASSSSTQAPRMAAATASLAALRRRLSELVLPSLAEARVRKRRLLRPDSRLDDWTVLRYDDGAPAVVVAPEGRGRVVLWTSTIDRDWADLPLHPGWLPLVRELIWASAGRVAGAERLTVEVAQPVIVDRRRGATRLEVRGGGELRSTLSAATQPEGRWRIPGLAHPGLWQLREVAPTGQRVRWAVVQPPVAENDPTLLRPLPQTTMTSAKTALSRAPLVPVAAFGMVGLFLLLVLEATILRRQGG